MDCNEEREEQADKEPACLEFTLLRRGHGSLLVSEPFGVLLPKGGRRVLMKRSEGIAAPPKGGVPAPLLTIVFTITPPPFSMQLQVFAEHLLCNRYCPRFMGLTPKKMRKGPVFTKLIFLERRECGPDNEQINSRADISSGYEAG